MALNQSIPSDEKIAEIKHEMQFVDPDAPDTPKG